MSKLEKLKQHIIDSWHLRIKKSRLTQEQLAKEAGINKATLSLILRGHTMPFASTVDKIENVLRKYENKIFEEKIITNK